MPYVESAQGKKKCVGAVCAANSEPRVRKLRNRLFKTLDGCTKNERLIIHDLHHRADNVVADRGMLGA